MPRKNKGLTLVELIIVMALMGIVISLAFSMQVFGKKTFSLGTEEYELQSSMRIASEKANRFVRYSTALFTIPKSSFRTDNLTPGWDYFGVMDVIITPANGPNPAVIGSQIVNYKYDAATGTHTCQVLVAPKANLMYKLVFDKTNPHEVDNLLKLTMEGYVNENGVASSKKISIATELDALNALQVINNGSASDPAVALAYRTDERPSSVVGHVAMVLDTSGSMDWSLGGNQNPSPNNKRIAILKNEAKSLVNQFALENNVDISLVPFADSANGPRSFKNAKTQTSALINDINSLSAGGGTNTGDGLRRAYYMLRTHNLSVGAGVTANNYVIVLVDGVTTFASVHSNANRNYYLDDGDINDGYLDVNPWSRYGQVEGRGNDLDPNGTEYVDLTGNMLSTSNFSKVFVIGFSSVSSDMNSLNDIAAACGAPSSRVFRADSATALADILKTIRQEIVNDLWHLQGPRL